MSLCIRHVTSIGWLVTARYRGATMAVWDINRSDALQRAMYGAFFGKSNGEVN